ncbi:ribosomal RNA processing protein 1 homolog B [Spinachia spinachia]
MASIQEPEVQLAQRLASNEKLVRTKAVKKLRKYINGRSQIATGGFSGDELLKLWKGLFYCLWMQDKPLLQEELSNQISGLMHSFHDVDGQLLYLESFLLTFKREWTGIDRLRMDKFFQLVRFMVRQTFEMLKRRNWESSAVAKFLKLLTEHLLQSGSGAPIGLQLHVLDLYISELAAVGSAELTADQNLILIEPFCNTAAKTKDRCLFSAICNSLFSTIIDQAPFAIEDLMKELKAAEDSDSGQASEEDCDNTLNENLSKAIGKKRARKQINGNSSNDSDSDDAELLQREDSDTEVSCDEDIGHVLQFNYGALADRLFELASRRSTLSRNRQRLYKIVKLLRDLNEGIFPQDEYPEEVSTDEDDDMFGSRKRMKRVAGHTEGKDGGVPGARKGGKKAAFTPDPQSQDSVKDDTEPADLTAKKKKRKRKTVQDGGADRSEPMQTAAQCMIPETKGGLSCSQEKKAQTLSSLKSVKATEGQTEPGFLLEGPTRPTVGAIEKNSQPQNCINMPCQTPEPKEEQQAPVGTEPDMSSEPYATLSGQKKCLTAKLHTDEVAAKLDINTEAKVSLESAEKDIATKPAKRKKRLLMAKNFKEAEVNGVSSTRQDSEEGISNNGLEKQTDSIAPCNKKVKRSNPLTEAQLEEEGEPTYAEVGSVVKEASQDATTMPLPEKKKKSKPEDTSHDSSPVLRLNKRKRPQTFQSNATVPRPLFCKTKGSNSKKNQTPKSESKKVTFGLKNNKTAEFRKTDRSLLVSPDGSLRVPFDPKQKPKFGVLKTPPTLLSGRKVPTVNRKIKMNTSKSTPKRRPSAADFF